MYLKGGGGSNDVEIYGAISRSLVCVGFLFPVFLIGLPDNRTAKGLVFTYLLDIYYAPCSFPSLNTTCTDGRRPAQVLFNWLDMVFEVFRLIIKSLH